MRPSSVCSCRLAGFSIGLIALACSTSVSAQSNAAVWPQRLPAALLPAGSGASTAADAGSPVAPPTEKVPPPSIQPLAAATLSLREAVERAVSSSARLRDVRARAVAAEALVKGAQVASMPQLSVLAGFTRTNHVDELGVPQPDGRLRVIFPDLPSNYQARLDGQWPLYTSGRVDALARSASADLDATQLDERTLRADLVLETSRVYWSVVAGRAAEQVLASSVTRLDAHLADVRARLAAGLVPPNEVAAIEAQQAGERATLIETRLQTEQQLVLLKHLVALPLDAQLTLSEVVEPAATGATTGGAGERPELQALDARARASHERAVAAAAERGPVVAMAAGLDLARPNARRLPRQDTWQHSWDVGVHVSWSLFDAGRIEARRAAALATEDAIRQQRSELTGRVAVEVAQRRLEVEASAARVGATESAVVAARENLRVVKARYEAGVATNTDVIDGEVALLRAELDRTRAQVNTHLATALLERAVAR